VDIATVPFAYTQYCLNGLNRPIVKRWKYVWRPFVGALVNCASAAQLLEECLEKPGSAVVSDHPCMCVCDCYVHRPWYAPGVQAVAGYTEVFDRYTFVTIRGAGHEVHSLTRLCPTQGSLTSSPSTINPGPDVPARLGLPRLLQLPQVGCPP
jgi:hypothetical protein